MLPGIAPQVPPVLDRGGSRPKESCASRAQYFLNHVRAVMQRKRNCLLSPRFVLGWYSGEVRTN